MLHLALFHLFQGNVEVWLLELLQQSQKSLHGVIRTASVVIKDPSFKLIEFMDNFPAQVGVTWISYNHVIGVCQLSQSAPEKQSRNKKPIHLCAPRLEFLK